MVSPLVQEELPLEIETITIQQNLLNLKVGEKVELIYYIQPVDLVDFELFFESSDETIATINDLGEVIGVSEGIATVSIRAANNVMSKINVYVTDIPVEIAERVYDANTIVIQMYYIIGLLVLMILIMLKNKKIGG